VHAKVDDLIRSLVKLHREDKEEEKKEVRLYSEWERTGDDPNLSDETKNRRMLEIRKDLDAIRLRRRSYWEKMFPHVRLKQI
jgi:hypothetical protein